MQYDQARMVASLRTIGDAKELHGTNFSLLRVDGPLNFDGITFDDSVDFSGAVFPAFVSFARARFSGPASFENVTFEGQVSFADATFGADVVFNEATFQRSADLSAIEVHGDLWCAGTEFCEGVDFARLKVHGSVIVAGVRFGPGGARFPGAMFNGPVSFIDAHLDGQLDLPDSTFSRALVLRRVSCTTLDLTAARCAASVVFDEVQAEGSVTLERATFNSARTLSPILAGRRIDLTESSFSARAELALQTSDVSIERTQFDRGTNLVVQAKSINLRHAAFLGPSILTGAGMQLAEPSNPRDVSTEPARVPELIALEGTDLAGGLEVAHVDLTRCPLAGALSLHRFRTGAGVVLPRTPRSWLWTDRRVVADEVIWRSRSSKLWARALPHESSQLQAADVAVLYRSLRREREESKDEPGAADLYYGEMEMRRHSAGTGRGERVLLSAYWALSGYGLRASRALSWFLLLVLLTAPTFYLKGFSKPGAPFAAAVAHPAVSSTDVPSDQPPGGLVAAITSWDSYIYTLGIATALTAPPEASLTPRGRALRLFVRALGPVLLGFALLALRGRVRR